MSNYLSSTVVSAMQSIVGIKRLVSGYAGHALDLRYQGDNATLTVDFLGDDTLDVASIATWVAARTGGPTNVRITKWYDQSGNGNHLVQATGTSQPSLETGSFLYKSSTTPAEGFPTVYFDEPLAPDTTNAFMTCATGSFANNNFHALWVSRYNDQHQDAEDGCPAGPSFQLGTASGNSCSELSDKIYVSTGSPLNKMFVEIDPVLGGTEPNTGHTHSWRLPNTNYTVGTRACDGTHYYNRFGNWRSEQISPGTAATGLTGFKLCTSFGTTFPYAGTLTAFMVGTKLGSTDEQTAMDTLAAAFSLTNTQTTLLAAEGDSITAGHVGSWPFRYFSWFASVSNSIGKTAACFNMAQDGGWLGKTTTPWGPLSGETGGTARVQKGGEAPDSLDKLLDSGQFTKQILIVYIGRNDITLYGSGASAGFGTTIYNELVTYCQARQSAGWKVIVCDSIPGSDLIGGNMASEQATFNSLIAANWATFADRFVQLSALNWQPGGSSDWSLYQDQVHPTAMGQAMIAAAILPKVQSLINSSFLLKRRRRALAA